MKDQPVDLLHSLVILDDYFLLIYDTLIPGDLWSILPVGSKFLRGDKRDIGTLWDKQIAYNPSGYRIIGHLPRNTAPPLLGVPMLPPIEEDTRDRDTWSTDEMDKAIAYGSMLDTNATDMTREEFFESLRTPIPVRFSPVTTGGKFMTVPSGPVTMVAGFWIMD